MASVGGGDAAAADAALGNLGLALRQEWVDAAVSALGGPDGPPGWASWPLHRRTESLFGQFLLADLNSAGAGCLPPGLQVGGAMPLRDVA